MSSIFKALTGQKNKSSSKTTQKENISINKQKTLLIASRGLTSKNRHLIQNLHDLLPNTKNQHTLDTKKNLNSQLPELATIYNCNNILYFENRKHQDLYLWISKNPNGPTVKFLLQDVHTALEQQFLGNCLKGSRPIVLFDKSFNTQDQYENMIFKELLSHTFGVSPNSRKLKPFIDHITMFSLIDGKIWVRNYEIQSKVKNLTEYEKSLENDMDNIDDDLQLIELGPRFIMTPIVVLEGCFGGPKIWENDNYVSPNKYRSFMKMESAKQAISRQEKKEQKKLNKRDNVIAPNELSNEVVFQQ
jgi:ribosome biogenesis protein BRX1